MTKSVEEVRKWVQIISDDYMHFTDEQKEYILGIADIFCYEVLPDDSGVIGWLPVTDFDCKKKLSVVLLYCRPEKRGRYLSYMFRRLDEIAKQEGAVEIYIGDSVSGYKSNKFNHILEYYGYVSCGHSKGVNNG